jgi:hypothetical protein
MRYRSKKQAALYRQRRRMLEAKYGPGPVVCESCGQAEANDANELQPRARGGSITDPGNVEALCRACHDRKHATNDLRHSWDTPA